MRAIIRPDIGWKRITAVKELYPQTFDGKKYELYKAYSTKSEADKTALSFRRIGISARVIGISAKEHYPQGGPWLVYIRFDRK